MPALESTHLLSRRLGRVTPTPTNLSLSLSFIIIPLSVGSSMIAFDDLLDMPVLLGPDPWGSPIDPCRFMRTAAADVEADDVGAGVISLWCCCSSVRLLSNSPPLLFARYVGVTFRLVALWRYNEGPN